MKNPILVLFVTLVLLFGAGNVSHAQCSMCRATVENNVKEAGQSERTIGAGLNAGILYLMAVPYLLAMAIGFFWYRESKKKSNHKIKVAAILKNRLT